MLATDKPRLTYSTVQTMLGELNVIELDGKVIRLLLPKEQLLPGLNFLASRYHVEPSAIYRYNSDARKQLQEYFAGTRTEFSLDLDFSRTTSFQYRILKSLCEITYATTTSYAELAKSINNPKAFRAVASVCSHNPFPIIIPCHRVIYSNGSIGDYRGGHDMKMALLRFEINQKITT